MKKFTLLFAMLTGMVGSVWADVQTDFVSVVNAIDGSANLVNTARSTTLGNGTVMSFALSAGNLFAEDVCNTEWNNTDAVSELNSILDKDLQASAYFPKTKANHNGQADRIVTCTANLSNTAGYDASKIVTFYVALYTRATTSTPSLSVSGFSTAEYQYALANGNGFTTVSSVSAIPCATQDYTLVKIKGKLSASVASVRFSTPTYSGVQWMAIKYNEEIPTVENTYTYYLGEKEIASIKHEDFVGSAPTGALSLPSYVDLVSTTAPEICGSEPATFKYYTQETRLPFKTDGTYYNLALNRNPNLQIYATEDVTNEIQTRNVARTVHTQYYYMWSFEGDWYHGYAIKNRAANAYVSYGTTANPDNKTKATLDTEKKNGSYFDLNIQGGYNYFPIHGTTNNAYISNNGGPTTTYLTNWNDTRNIGDVGAQVIITEAVEIEYDRTELNNAIAKAQSYVGHIGTELGQYQGLTPGELSAGILVAQSFLESTDQTEIDAATAALNEALAKLTLNMPVDGHYYTLQGVVGESTHGNKQYMIGATVSVQGKGNRLVLSAEPEGYNNVFQYVDGKLLSVTANCYVVNNGGFLNLGDADAEGVAIEFTPSTAVGTYLVKFKNGNTDRCTWSRFEGYIDGADYYANREVGYQWNIVESNYVPTPTTANMKITAAQWGTFWAPFAVEIPEGVKAYTGEMKGDWIKMTEVEGVIPANTGVVVTSEQLVDVDLQAAESNPAALQTCYTGNTTGAIMDVEQGAYLLQKQDEQVGWYKVSGEGFTLAPNRCYLAKGSVPEPNQSRTFFGFAPDDATGINSIATEAKTKADGKYMVNGQIVVVKAGKAYYMNGTEVK